MARDTLTGSRIRERRIMSGMRQADLARLAGISPSYLNLIEHNRRRIGGKLLLDIAEVLKVEPSILTEGAEATLIAALREAAAARPEAGAELDRVDEFAGRFPGWAGLLAASLRRISTLENTVETLSDRLTHDPHLAASLHEMITTVTAIRSTAGILVETREIEPEWRERFQRNINEDAQRLAESSQALVSYLDSADDAEADLNAPQDALDAFLADHDYHLEELERPGADPRALAERLPGSAARSLALPVFERLAEDARALPYADFVAATAEFGPDPVALAHRFDTDPARVMRRLAALPEADVTGPLGLVIADASGMLTFRRPVRGFPVPRFGAACPLWPLFRAFSRPQVPLRDRVVQPGTDGAAFLCHAIAQPVTPPRVNRDPVLVAHMLIVPVPGGEEAARDALPVGASCRVCPRALCDARSEPSILAEGF